MHILFADDDDRRYREFTSNMVGCVVARAKTPKEAISLLEKHHTPPSGDPTPYDVIFLDYDFDAEHKGVNGYGQDITEWITDTTARADAFRESFFVIHSLNRAGKEIMMSQLDTFGMSVIVMPFAWQQISPDRLKELWITHLEADK